MLIPVAAVAMLALGLLTDLAVAQTRAARLLDGARKEGGLLWYSSADTEDALALIQKFQEQHPFLKVEHFRAPSEKLLQRILVEARAKAFRADVVSVPEIELNILTKQNLLVRHDSPEQAAYPPEMKDPRGYWNGMYVSAWVLAYNTKLVSRANAPKTYKDLLDPRWKGLIALDTEAFSWFVTSLRYLEAREGRDKALDYFKKLARQDIQWRKGHSLIGQLLVAGEFPLAAELQVHNVERSKAQGAPVDWVALDGVIPIHKIGIAMTSTGTRPNAAALFYDFILSRTGMEAIKRRHRIPTRPDVPVPYLQPYRLLPFDAQAMDEFDGYVSLFRDIFKPGA